MPTRKRPLMWSDVVEMVTIVDWHCPPLRTECASRHDDGLLGFSEVKHDIRKELVYRFESL
jgi:hypothetical protein